MADDLRCVCGHDRADHMIERRTTATKHIVYIPAVCNLCAECDLYRACPHDHRAGCSCDPKPVYDGDDTASTTPAEALVALSRWIDAGNTHRDPEAVTWGYLAKISEECGEVIDAFMGATGFNPRKGVVGSVEVEVVEESLDVAVTALIAIEHITGLHGYALGLLNEKIMRTANRAGVLS